MLVLSVLPSWFGPLRTLRNDVRLHREHAARFSATNKRRDATIDSTLYSDRETLPHRSITTRMTTRETIDLLAETHVSSAEYRLLELPPEIAALLERADESSQAKTSKKRKLATSHGNKEKHKDEEDRKEDEWEWNNRRKV